MNHSTPPPHKTTKTTSTTTVPSFLSQLIALDTILSYHLHTISQPLLPHSFLILLELSADFSSLFIISVSLLLFLRHLFFTPLPLGLLLDLTLIGLIKPLVCRSRLHYNINTNPAFSYIKQGSFPSGHASRVFIVAVLLHLSAEAIIAALVELRSNNNGFVAKMISWDESKVVNFIVGVAWFWALATSVSRLCLGGIFSSMFLPGHALVFLKLCLRFTFCGSKIILRYRNASSVVCNGHTYGCAFDQ